MREYCITKPDGKAIWTDDEIITQSGAMGITDTQLRDIISDMCHFRLSVLQTDKIGSKSIQYLYITQDQEDIAKRLNQRKNVRIRSSFKTVLTKTDRQAAREIREAKTTTGFKSYKKQMLSQLMSFLILTNDIRAAVHRDYSHLGFADLYWDEFIKHITKTNIKEWHSKLNKSNYPQFFYTYLNNLKEPIEEALEMQDMINK